MQTDTRNLVTVTEVGRNASQVVAAAALGHWQVILKNSKPLAAVVDIESAERLHRIDELEEDLKLLTAALVRMATDNGVRHSLDDVMSRYGIDVADLEEE